MESQQKPPIIAHVIFSLGVGGLENGVVNLINRMPEEKYRHVIICVQNSTDFSQRISKPDVAIYELHKQPGHDWKSFIKMYRLLKQINPDIVHTRNLATIEYQLPAVLAGIKHRIHGEHGWDVFDPEGNNKKYQLLRRVLGLMIQRFIALSQHLEQYLLKKVGIPAKKITRICNGVDTKKFYPAEQKQALSQCPFPHDQGLVFIGTVGRMHGVKDQMTLVKAFVQMLTERPGLKANARLLVIGDGPLRQQALDYLKKHGLSDFAWLPGKRDDVAEIMRYLDLFVLPSQAEGISNTILEAMATALPVVATQVGGNPELVDDGKNGMLVEKESPADMAHCLIDYLEHPQKREAHGQQSLQRVNERFSLDRMVEQYLAVYDECRLG